MKRRDCRVYVLLLTVAVMIASTVDAEPVGAAIVPAITIDPSSYSATHISNAYISGNVSPAVGQIVKLISPDRKGILAAVRLANNGSRASFSFRVPEQVLKAGAATTLYIKTNSAGYVSASGYIAVRVSVGNAAATTPTTPPNQQGQAAANNGNSQNRQAAEPARPRTAAAGRAAAVAWAKGIAADNSFSYGTVPYSRHNGCYYCGTNGGKKRRAKGTKWAKGYDGKKWNKTYCCNPFIHACYAHGAQHPTMLRYCRKMSAIDMTKASYRKMGCFKCIGKPKFSKLIPGDIFVGRNHVWMYCGNGEMVESTSLGGGKRSWSADSIRVNRNAKKKYGSCRFVMRFTGY